MGIAKERQRMSYAQALSEFNNLDLSKIKFNRIIYPNEVNVGVLPVLESSVIDAFNAWNREGKYQLLIKRSQQWFVDFIVNDEPISFILELKLSPEYKENYRAVVDRDIRILQESLKSAAPEDIDKIKDNISGLEKDRSNGGLVFLVLNSIVSKIAHRDYPECQEIILAQAIYDIQSGELTAATPIELEDTGDFYTIQKEDISKLNTLNDTSWQYFKEYFSIKLA